MIAIATTDLTERAKLAMSHLGLLSKIDMVAGAEMVEKNKPHPEMIHLILTTLLIPPEKAVMVGDAITDVQMGVSAGLRASIGVSSGLTVTEDLLTITPFVVPDISCIKIRL
jgi:phosphoglycolate phosphatase-like HAD superfamily hydrolase